VQELYSDDTALLIEVQNDARLDLLGLHNGGFVQTQVQRVALFVEL
jgi:hypothetical protein